MKRLSIVALTFAAACGSSSPIVAAPVDVTNARLAGPEYTGPAPADDVVRLRVPVDGTEPSRGPADAKVTVVVFSDFQCPFCARVRPTLDRVVQTYGESVRIVWRNLPLPFHENAKPAAALAMEAFRQRGDEGFWAAHDLLFMNQRALTAEDLRRYGNELGLDPQGVFAALGGAHDAQIEADIALAGSIGVRGTPGFIVNGEQLMGAQPFTAFQAAIERATAAADFVIANGAAEGNVYAALMQHASDSPTPPAPRPDAPSRRAEPDPSLVYNVPLTGPLPSRGAANALVSIVVFSDFQCPFCSRLEPSFDEILQRYPNDLRIVWMNNPLPFHREAMPAAQAALEAFDQGGDAQFWAYHQRLFANQRALTRPDLERYAQEIGLDMTMFRAALDNNEHQQTIEAQAALARRIGARGTPSSFINGRNVRGAQPAAAFIPVIDEELARARAAIASGTPRADIYNAMVSNGLNAPPAPAPGAAAPPRAPAPDANRDYGIAVPASAPSRGPSSARVVIQTFSDFQCPFCSRVLPTVERIMQQYGNQVRFVWRNYPLPFHSDAPLAAEAAMEAYAQRGDAGFWAYHDLLFANQRSLGRAELETYAQQVGGIDMARFRAALDNRTHRALVDADIAAVRDSGARIGTPSFFINGRLVQGAQPFEAFRVAIDRELAR